MAMTETTSDTQATIERLPEETKRMIETAYGKKIRCVHYEWNGVIFLPTGVSMVDNEDG